MTNNPFAWLHGTHVVKQVSKTQEAATKAAAVSRVAVRGHDRGRPARTPRIEVSESPTYEAAEKRAVGHFATKAVLRAGHNTGAPGAKMEKTMHEFKVGGLHSGSKTGPKVTSRKQAIAIGMNQARKAAGKKA